MTNLRAGLLAIAVLVAAGCDVSLPPSPPGLTPSPARTSVPPTPAPTPTPSARIACGRIDTPDCRDAVAAARAFAPDAFATAALVVVDSECPPGAFCAFNAGFVVVTLPGGPGSNGWRAFAVRPLDPVVELPYPRLPVHMLELLPAEVRPS